MVTEEQHKHKHKQMGDNRGAGEANFQALSSHFHPSLNSPSVPVVDLREPGKLLANFVSCWVKEVRSVGGDQRDGVALALSASTQFCKFASIAVWFTNLTNLQIGFSFMMHRAH